MERFVIIVAGGAGTRMKSDIPKQFLPLHGKPVILHTIDKFQTAEPGIHVYAVISPDWIEHFRELCEEYIFPGPEKIITGGESRFHSVKNGVKQLPVEEGLVAVHDAVRPLVSPEVIISTMEAAENFGAAVPVVSLKESIRRIKGADNKALNRENYCQVQTPQCFKISLLKKAYARSYKKHFTDSASVIEDMGHAIHLVAGNEENIKITTRMDMRLAELLL